MKPGRREALILARIREKYAAKGVEFAGNGMDSADKIREFVKEHPVGYPILAADATAIDLMRLDRAGKVGYRKLGTVTGGTWREFLLASYGKMPGSAGKNVEKRKNRQITEEGAGHPRAESQSAGEP